MSAESKNDAEKRTKAQIERRDNPTPNSSMISNNIFSPKIWKFTPHRFVQLLNIIAALVAILTFLVWLSEHSLREEERSLRRTQLILDSNALIENSRDGLHRPLVDDAVRRLLQSKFTNLSDCQLNYSGLSLRGLNIEDKFCKLELDQNTHFDNATFNTPLLQICEKCSSKISPNQQIEIDEWNKNAADTLFSTV